MDRGTNGKENSCVKIFFLCWDMPTDGSPRSKKKRPSVDNDLYADVSVSSMGLPTVEISHEGV